MERVPAEAISLAGIAAVSWVPLTKVVDRLEPLTRTADPLTKGVQSLKFQRPSPVFLADKADRSRARILVAKKSNPSQGYLAVSKAGEGEVIVLGISLWWYWIAGDAERGADNALLLQNALTKPRRGT